MGFRFRRSISILPGLRLNLSKNGLSTSIGPRGATLNFGPRGPRYTVGIPGTGLSYSDRIALASSPTRTVGASAFWGYAIGMIVLMVIIALVSTNSRSGEKPAAATSGAVSPRRQAFQARGGRVTASALRCRADPSKEASVVGTLRRGDWVNPLDTSVDWWRVRYSGFDCWIDSRFIHAA